MNRAAKAAEGTYILPLEKVWELTGEDEEPPTDSVTLMFIPIAKGTSLEDMTWRGADESLDMASAVLYASRGWQGSVCLQEGVAYLVMESLGDDVASSFATEYATVSGDGTVQSSWTINIRSAEEGAVASKVTFSGDTRGLVWQELAEEGGSLRVTNSDHIFKVKLNWDDLDDLGGVRPEHVTLTLEQKGTDEQGQETWTAV